MLVHDGSRKNRLKATIAPQLRAHDNLTRQPTSDYQCPNTMPGSAACVPSVHLPESPRANVVAPRSPALRDCGERAPPAKGVHADSADVPARCAPRVHDGAA